MTHTPQPDCKGCRALRSLVFDKEPHSRFFAPRPKESFARTGSLPANVPADGHITRITAQRFRTHARLYADKPAPRAREGTKTRQDSHDCASESAAHENA
eukprot:6202587-Pleurochrysis_carterae.AAC.4